MPLIYLDEEEDVPKSLKEIKFNNRELLKVYIMNILIIYDILNDLFDCQYDKIIETKKNPFELPKQADFVVGKEYINLDFGKENILCELIINIEPKFLIGVTKEEYNKKCNDVTLGK